MTIEGRLFCCGVEQVIPLSAMRRDGTYVQLCCVNGCDLGGAVCGFEQALRVMQMPWYNPRRRPASL